MWGPPDSLAATRNAENRATFRQNFPSDVKVEIPVRVRNFDQVGRKGKFAEKSLGFPEFSEFLDFSDLKIVNGDDPV